MRFFLPKYISENKRLFTVFGALFGFLIFIIVLILIYPFVLNLIPTSITEDKISKDFNKEFLKNREGPLYGIGGYVTKVEDKDSERLITIKSDVGQTYYATVDENTKVISIERKAVKEGVETITNNITSNQINTNDRVYLRSSNDLLLTNEIQTKEVVSIEVFIK